MSKIYNLTGVIVLIMIFSQNANSQVVKAGVTVGVNRFSHNSDNADFYWSNSDMLSPGRLNDDRFTSTLGIVTEISPAENSNSALQIRLSYNSYSFKSDFQEKNNDTTDLKFSKNSSGMHDTTKWIVYRNDFTLESISLDLLYKYNFISNMSLLAGTKLNYFSKTDIYAAKLLISPLEAQFKRQTGKVYTDNDRTMVIYDNNEIKDFSRFNLGLSLGLQYSLKCSDFEINPFVIYDMYFTEIMPGRGWRLTAFNMGIDVMFAL